MALSSSLLQLTRTTFPMPFVLPSLKRNDAPTCTNSGRSRKRKRTSARSPVRRHEDSAAAAGDAAGIAATVDGAEDEANGEMRTMVAAWRTMPAWMTAW